jgi:hypothetical protein
MAKSNAEFAGKVLLDQVQRTEDHMLQMCGGDDLFRVWSMLSMVVRAAEAETGKSIREDEFTRNKAERDVLGYIPSIFRNLPESYSDFRRRVASNTQDRLPLSDLGSLGGLAPLGWTGPWPPTDK